MNNEFICTVSFSLDFYDEDGLSVENKKIHITSGTLWRLSKSLGLSDIRLEEKNGTRWIEIKKETLTNHFKKIEKEIE